MPPCDIIFTFSSQSICTFSFSANFFVFYIPFCSRVVDALSIYSGIDICVDRTSRGNMLLNTLQG